MQAVIRRKKNHYVMSEPRITAENVLNREFTANSPNEKWLVMQSAKVSAATLKAVSYTHLQLEAENRRLQMENDFLKKLNELEGRR